VEAEGIRKNKYQKKNNLPMSWLHRYRSLGRRGGMCILDVGRLAALELLPPLLHVPMEDKSRLLTQSMANSNRKNLELRLVASKLSPTLQISRKDKWKLRT
jgi:hypothetical protein